MPPQDASLLMAAVKGRVEMAYDALNKGAQINCRDGKEGNTPLILAARHKNYDMVEFLLTQGAQIEVLSHDGEKTPLLVACFMGDVNIVLLLLERGASVETMNQRGDTPLLVASHNGNTDVVRVLLSRGANMNRRTIKNGYSPLYVATNAGYISVVRELLAQVDEVEVDIHDNTGVTPLICAITNHHIAIMKLLMASGANIHLKDGQKRTPLLNAINAKCAECVEILIAENVDIEKLETGTSFSPLMRAASLGQLEIMQLLVTLGGANITHSVPITAPASTTTTSSNKKDNDKKKSKLTPPLVDLSQNNADSATNRATGSSSRSSSTNAPDFDLDPRNIALPPELNEAMEKEYSRIEITIVDDVTKERVVTTPEVMYEFMNSGDTLEDKEDYKDEEEEEGENTHETSAVHVPVSGPVQPQVVSALSLARNSGCKKCVAFLEEQMTCKLPEKC